MRTTNQSSQRGRKWSRAVGLLFFLVFLSTLAGLVLTRPQCSGRRPRQDAAKKAAVRAIPASVASPTPTAPITPSKEGNRVVIYNRLDDESGADPVTISSHFGTHVIKGGDTLVLRLSPGRHRTRFVYASFRQFNGVFDIVVTEPRWRTAPDGRRFFCSALVWI